MAKVRGSLQIIALLFFRRISKFVVTRDSGGYVQHTSGFGGDFGDIVIQMAPYYFPTFTIASIIIRPFLPTPWFPYYDGLIGFTIGYQLFSTFEEIKRNWSSELFTSADGYSMVKTDIAKTGYIVAVLFILCLTLSIYGLSFYMITSGYHGFADFYKIVYQTSAEFYLNLYKMISPYINSLQKVIMKFI